VRQRIERRALQRALGATHVTVVDDPTSPLERPSARDGDGPLLVTVRDQRAWAAVARSGSAGLGEGYFRGWWHTDDLVGVLRSFVVGLGPLDRFRNRLHRWTRPITGPARRLRPSSKHRDRRNVRAHYDLGNEFFASFLDETMTYSSAVFASPNTPLEEASRAKLDRLCRKLGIQPDQAVAEIGTGWGSFALHAAGTYGARVTTTTVSAAQAALARQRFEAAGLTDRITLLESDYRDLTGQYERLVSIEMIEAVDWRDVPEYLRTCERLLTADGLLGLQAITVADQRYSRARLTTDFIKRWVFPGGCLPSVTSIAQAATAATDLRIVDVEDLGAHYAETLARWRTQLHAMWDDLPWLGISEEFGRLWDFYLAYCEAAFRERHVSVVQIVMARPGWRPDGLSLRPV
jgi:cyclopropane-fatty-acyl-phospholipid synthase